MCLSEILCREKTNVDIVRSSKRKGGDGIPTLRGESGLVEKKLLTCTAGESVRESSVLLHDCVGKKTVERAIRGGVFRGELGFS